MNDLHINENNIEEVYLMWHLVNLMACKLFGARLVNVLQGGEIIVTS